MEGRDEEEDTSGSVKTGFTCCGCFSLRSGVVVFSVIILILGILGVTVMAVYVARNVSTLQWDDISVTSTSLAFWSSVIGLTIFGLFAAWKQKSGLVELYFWTFLVHWVLDMASAVVLLVVVYQKWQGIAQMNCEKITPRQACIEPYKIRVILLTCILCIYKILGACACYLIYRYRNALIAQEKKSTPILRWLRRASSSSLSSIFEKKWWSPSQVPVIKIDFASDQSSASSYSNESAPYHTTTFGQLYPSLAAPPPGLFINHVGDEGVASHELPALPSYSVVGSERGALT